MNSFIKVIDGKLVCLWNNHNELIEMIVKDQGFSLSEKFWCFKCFQEKRLATTNLIRLEEAQILFEEQLFEINNEYEISKAFIIDDLKKFLDRIMNQKSNMLKVFDEIQRITSMWIVSIQQMGLKLDLSSFVESIDVISNPNQYQRKIADLLDNNNKSYYYKILTQLKKLMIQEELNGCKDILNETIKLKENQLIRYETQEIKQNDSIKILTINDNIQNKNEVKSVKLINSTKQSQFSAALAFNYSGSIMIAGCDKDIKVWKFTKGQLQELKRLKGHKYAIYCLVFSKQFNWFFSGSYDTTIKCWKEQNDNNWINNQTGNEHKNTILCLLLNKTEDQLISSSRDNDIKVWQVNYQSNYLHYDYTLKQIHKGYVYCISMNKSETSLISCSQDKQIILWNKNQQNKWIYQNHIIMDDYGCRICFISNNQIAWQQSSKGITHIIENQNGELKKRNDLNILLNQYGNSDCDLFPTIYNKQKQIIIQKYDKRVYILQKNNNLITIQQSIEFANNNHFGSLTENGDYLVIYDYGTQKFNIYNILYQ